MELRAILSNPFGAGQAILLAGWAISWLFNPELGSPDDKDLWAPVFLTWVLLVPLGLIFGVLAGRGANGPPKRETISYIAFAVVTALVGNALTYFPDDLFYCDVGDHSSCATSVLERVLGLGAMEGALLLQLGIALRVRSRSRAREEAADRGKAAR
ncbi:MAG: hypothetical protein M3273_03520 [Actinomycetota bacterium]|nr:hypothetical protein [Actinomycetota bacterium]